MHLFSNKDSNTVKLYIINNYLVYKKNLVDLFNLCNLVSGIVGGCGSSISTGRGARHVIQSQELPDVRN